MSLMLLYISILYYILLSGAIIYILYIISCWKKVNIRTQAKENSRNCLICKVACLNWSSIYAGLLNTEDLIPMNEWTCQKEEEKSSKERKLLLPFPLFRLLPEDMVFIKGGSIHHKCSGLKVLLWTSNNLIKTSLAKLWPAVQVLIPHVVTLTAK